MSPTQTAIVNALADGEWHTARSLRDAIAPATGVNNMRVQIYNLRDLHGVKIEGDNTGPRSRGYRLLDDAA